MMSGVTRIANIKNGSWPVSYVGCNKTLLRIPTITLQSVLHAAYHAAQVRLEHLLQRCAAFQAQYRRPHQSTPASPVARGDLQLHDDEVDLPRQYQEEVEPSSASSPVLPGSGLRGSQPKSVRQRASHLLPAPAHPATPPPSTPRPAWQAHVRHHGKVVGGERRSAWSAAMSRAESRQLAEPEWQQDLVHDSQLAATTQQQPLASSPARPAPMGAVRRDGLRARTCMALGPEGNEAMQDGCFKEVSPPSWPTTPRAVAGAKAAAHSGAAAGAGGGAAAGAGAGVGLGAQKAFPAVLRTNMPCQEPHTLLQPTLHRLEAPSQCHAVQNSTGAGGREASEQAVREGDRPQTASSQGKAGAESTWALTQREADLGMLAGSAAVAGLLPGAAQTMQPLVLRTPSWLGECAWHACCCTSGLLQMLLPA
ncbi:hypothetical protein V8C86DRAFT_452374 [Haematococcus lacustris]